MATNKKQFTLRMQEETFRRVQAIAKHQRRSMAVMIELILESYIYEYDHPEIFKEHDEDNKKEPE